MRVYWPLYDEDGGWRKKTEKQGEKKGKTEVID